MKPDPRNPLIHDLLHDDDYAAFRQTVQNQSLSAYHNSPRHKSTFQLLRWGVTEAVAIFMAGVCLTVWLIHSLNTPHMTTLQPKAPTTPLSYRVIKTSAEASITRVITDRSTSVVRQVHTVQESGWTMVSTPSARTIPRLTDDQLLDLFPDQACMLTQTGPQTQTLMLLSRNDSQKLE
jgi:hypothetical protein